MEKNRTGLGQEVDVPMVDAMIGFNLVEHFGGHTFVPVEENFGWARVLTPERVPHQTADGWISHENAYVLDQGLITKREHPTEGEYYATRTPFAMSRTPISFSRHGPLLGEDTFTILEDLGYSADRVHALADASVVTATSPQATSS
ncbi:hypothetical protein C5613_24295 [Rhodococcus opacus]|uniref:Uncharacterized protein n=1 Tax=Rhodococcus opacus TaxID=37919 RepID=A0A2S8J680_RHOOP|nr:hypothetical protein C5613_24295 [Rhodococcus opacus]